MFKGIMAGIKSRRKKAEQPPVVQFAHSAEVESVLKRRRRERAKKFRRLNSFESAQVVSNILKKQQQPLEYKLTKGVRDNLAAMIVLALAQKNR